MYVCMFRMSGSSEQLKMAWDTVRISIVLHCTYKVTPPAAAHRDRHYDCDSLVLAVNKDDCRQKVSVSHLLCPGPAGRGCYF